VSRKQPESFPRPELHGSDQLDLVVPTADEVAAARMEGRAVRAEVEREIRRMRQLSDDEARARAV
jgi:hypothetical protein